jgi:hypothetical protein
MNFCKRRAWVLSSQKDKKNKKRNRLIGFTLFYRRDNARRPSEYYFVRRNIFVDGVVLLAYMAFAALRYRRFRSPDWGHAARQPCPYSGVALI